MTTKSAQEVECELSHDHHENAINELAEALVELRQNVAASLEIMLMNFQNLETNQEFIKLFLAINTPFRFDYNMAEDDQQ